MAKAAATNGCAFNVKAAVLRPVAKDTRTLLNAATAS